MLESIQTYLESAGIEIVSSDRESIITKHKAGEVTYEIQGFVRNNFPYETPSFYLRNRSTFGLLAHVGWPCSKQDTGLICSGANDVLSINYHVPEKLYEEALTKATQTIAPVIKDASLNNQHCLEEFYGHWKWAAGRQINNLLVIAPEGTGIFDLQIKEPVKKGRGLSSKAMASPSNYDSLSKDYCVVVNAASKGRSIHGKGILFTAPCIGLPPAPGADIKTWWKDFLARQPEELIATLKEKARHTRSKEAWIVCHTQYQTRDIWFGIKAESHKKCQIPVCGDYLEPWKISAIEVDIHSKSRLLPRAGASTDLQDKKILLVGCGSVGSNIAEQLISAGIGGLHLVDSDSFQSENLYRHTLDMKYLGVNKASALADKLMNEYPYTKITHSPKQLISLDVEELTQADLITIAIGNPTAERALNEILIKEKINTPVIYCWLEGYGVGGHAVFVAPDGNSGCLECAYVDPSSYQIQMHSNMNFLMANEPVTKDIGGCGTLFLPYSHLDALQTAIMASRLALKSLAGQQNKSTKMSWIGSDEDAKGIGLSFNGELSDKEGTMTISPLKQAGCPCCHKSSIGATYTGYGKIVHISVTVEHIWDKYRQRGKSDIEACGILIGRIDQDGSRIWIEVVTEPFPKDVRGRTHFHMKDKGHQIELNRLHKSSSGQQCFMGTWHSHPEHKPSFSSPDKTGWKSCINANPPLKHFCFAIIGTEEDSIFIPNSSGFVELKRMEHRE